MRFQRIHLKLLINVLNGVWFFWSMNGTLCLCSKEKKDEKCRFCVTSSKCWITEGNFCISYLPAMRIGTHEWMDCLVWPLINCLLLFRCSKWSARWDQFQILVPNPLQPRTPTAAQSRCLTEKEMTTLWWSNASWKGIVIWASLRGKTWPFPNFAKHCNPYKMNLPFHSWQLTWRVTSD